MIAKLQQITSRFPDEVKRAMYQEANIEMTEAKRLTPWDTGALRASGHVLEPVRSGRGISVTLAFSEDYAVYVHEDLTAFHPHGEAKFLERPLKESAPYMAARISRRINLNNLIG